MPETHEIGVEAGLPVWRMPAAAPIPYGTPVKPVLDGKRCAIATDLAEAIGVARRSGRGEHGYDRGELVTIQRGGGVRTALAADAELRIEGAIVKLFANEPHYLELHDGKPVRADRRTIG